MNAQRSILAGFNLWLLLAATLLLDGCCSFPKGQSAPSKISVAAVVAEVQVALERVQSRLEQKKLPKLQSVTLSLETTLSAKASGGFDVWVLEVGGSYQKDRSESVDITLTPPASEKVHGNLFLLERPSLTDQLEKAIIGAVEDLQAHYPGNKIPLDVAEVDVTIGFAVTWDASAKVKITPLSAELGGELSKATAHTIKVVYSNN